MGWEKTVLTDEALLKLCISFPKSMRVAKNCALEAQALAAWEACVKEMKEDSDATTR